MEWMTKASVVQWVWIVWDGSVQFGFLVASGSLRECDGVRLDDLLCRTTENKSLKG